MRKIGLIPAFIIMLIIALPGFITFLFGTETEYGLTEPIARSTVSQPDSSTSMPVFNPSVTEETIPGHMFPAEIAEPSANIPFEEYICGVVAAEMPTEYGPEALKAQAVAARTYAFRRLQGSTRQPLYVTPDDIENIFQAYLGRDELSVIWGEAFEDNFLCVSEAVYSTRGEIMVYAGKPVEAVFHSSSAGMTEDSQNVWNKDYPYLKSVVSGENVDVSEKTFGSDELAELFRNSAEGPLLPEEDFLSQFEIISRSDAGYVLLVQVGDVTLTGGRVRELLGLKSSAFSVRGEGNTVIFTCRGYGHGVGMSQKGAEYMANNGENYKRILQHYYFGVSFASI